MANRWFEQFRFGLEKRMVDIYCNFAVGATGAPTISVPFSKGVKSIVRTGVGAYTITLQNTYVGLYCVLPTIKLAAGSPVAPLMVVRAEDVDGAKTIQVQFLDGTLAAGELPSGAGVVLKFELKDSTV